MHPPNCIIQTVGVDFPADPGFVSLLRRFGVTADDCLGHGGEARVYALGDDRVLRVLHRGGRADDVVRRHRLVSDLRRARPPFALPDVLEVGESGGRGVFAVERRLPGRSVLDELGSCVGPARRRLVESHLETAAALGDLHLGPRRDFGDLVLEDPITTPTWRAYLARRAATNLARSTSEFRSVDPDALVDGLPEAAGPAFVHLDAFAGNMLTDGTRITAVIDIGSTCVAGDRRFDPLSAAVYLAAPEITPVATAADIDVAMSPGCAPPACTNGSTLPVGGWPPSGRSPSTIRTFSAGPAGSSWPRRRATAETDSVEVSLSAPSPSDADEFIDAVRASRQIHHPWIDPPDTTDRFAAYLERATRPDQASYLIRHASCGHLVGFVNVNNIVYGALRSGYLGYGAFAPHARRGLMTAGLAAVLGVVFGPLALHRVEANIQPGNRPSIDLVRRLGFEHEGFSRRYLKVDGQWRDHERWALLGDCWAGGG